MKIKLDKNHFLNSDPQCYWVTVEVKSEKSGKTYERVASGYYSDPLDAINSYVDRKVRASEATTIEQLIKEVEALKKQIKSWKPKVERARGKEE